MIKDAKKLVELDPKDDGNIGILCYGYLMSGNSKELRCFIDHLGDKIPNVALQFKDSLVKLEVTSRLWNSTISKLF